jgi:Zn-finger nucleic acid-binding protein
MPVCPICNQALDLQRQREGLFYSCSKCGGRALTIPQVRRVAGDKMGARLLRALGNARLRTEHACPHCRTMMVRVSLANPSLEVDGCRPCTAIWFDAPTYELLPEGTAETTNALPLLSTEIFAERKLKEQKEREAREEAERKKKRGRRTKGAL